MPIVFAPKNLSDLDLQEIELIFEHMDPSCFTIDFSHDEKFGLNPNHWGKILQILPKKIFTLIFSSKQLCHCSQEDLFIIFNEKPQNIKCLDFGYCALSRMSEEKRNLMLETCTQNLHSLSLSGNKLYQLKRFDQLAHSLNKQLLSLNLSNNLLANMQLIEFLNNIKSPLHHLDLQGNYIADTEEELVRLIQALPDTIYSIRLEILWTISLKVPFGFLKNIVYLNLDGSALFHKEMQILADELSALPPSLKHLQLTNNALHVKSPQALAVLFAHIPLSVRTILVDKSKLSLAQVNVLSKDPRVQFEAKPKNASFTFFSSDAASGVENRLITAKL